MSTTTTTTLVPRGPFSLDATKRFACSFTPAAGSVTADPDALRLVFLLDRTHEPVSALARERSDGAVELTLSATRDPEAATRQVARILSLDHDGRALATIAARDPAVGRLVQANPGFRPLCFASPYEAAVWGVLAQRTSMRQASGLRKRLAEAFGGSVTLGGETSRTLPAPARLLTIDALPGASAVQIERLRAVARAALSGVLDAEHLRGLPTERALAELATIPGIGPWTAQHVLLRGTGIADALPTVEPRVLRALSEANGWTHTATVAELTRASESWRPLRMWICVLMVSQLAGAARWHGPEPRGAALARRKKPQPTLFTP